MKKDNEQKFEFGIEFQEAILHFIIFDAKGYRALELVEDSYFTLISHMIIASSLKQFYGKKKRVPSKPILKETLRELYETKRIGELVMDDDKKEIDRVVDKLYTTQLRDSDEILEKIIQFARYVNLKTHWEEADLLDFTNYSSFANKIQHAINIGSNIKDEKGIFMVRDHQDRILSRGEDEVVFPTPFWQINNWMNARGLTPASLILIAAEAKRFKTGWFINLVRGYMRMKKNVIWFDFENGTTALSNRMDQSFMKDTKSTLLSGVLDKRLAKLMRKFKRLGVELVIKRFPAYKTTTNDLQAFVDKVYLEDGIKFDEAVFDYADLMGATTGRLDDDKRISDVYVDIKNFLEFNKYESGWTASHVNRQGAEKRKGTKYEANDLAKAIDKIRHVDLAIGLQETEEEIEAGVMRAEIIDGRDNVRNGNALFWVDVEKQHMQEFTKGERQEYYSQSGNEDPQEKRPKGPSKKVEKKSDL